jgi:hypothetical protein
MPFIRLTSETYIELGKHALVAVRSTGVPQPDGMILVPIDDDVHESLEAMRAPGETDDDLIQRVIHRATGRPAS